MLHKAVYPDLKRKLELWGRFLAACAFICPVLYHRTALALN
jgi:hypothetical protein